MEKSFKDMIEEKFGDIFVIDEQNDDIDVISTGALSLDVSLGKGGIPRGRITELFGVESSGKTTLALSIAKNAIEQGLKVLYVDPEQGVDYTYAKALIGDFDTNQFVLVQPETAEESLQIIEDGFKSGEFGLVVLDSIGALAPQVEKDKDLTASTVGVLSKLLTIWLRRNAYTIRKSNVAMVFINQVRDKIGAYVPTFETPGGRAIKHFTSVRISLSRGTEITQSDETIGIMSKFTIKKNKVGVPFRSSTVPLIFGIGIDTFRDFVLFAESIGVLQKRGAYYVFEGETIGQGLVKTMAILKENQELLDKIKEIVYNSVNKIEPVKEVVDGEEN